MQRYFLAVIFTLMIMIGGCTDTQDGENDMNNTGAVLSFSSFDGGDPKYCVVLGSDIVPYKSSVKYSKANHKVP